MPFYRAYNPFWDYVNSFDPVGHGVDRSFEPGLGGLNNVYMAPGGQWRRGGPHARGPCVAGAAPHGCGRRGQACDGAANASASAPPVGNGAASADNHTPTAGADNAPASGNNENSNENSDSPRGHPHCHRGGRRGHCRRQQPTAAPFDGLIDTLRAFGGQPLAEAVRELFEAETNGQDTAAAEQHTSADKPDDTASTDKHADNDDGTTFTPPVDLFDTEAAWVLHVAVPGADKKDVSVDWDAERSLLTIGGMVHRPGDETFLQSLAQAERRVGLFRRTVKLPPGDAPAAGDSEKERTEVDGDNITARMENGLLVVTVPKAEKE